MRAYIREALFFSENLRPDFQLGRLDVLVEQAVEMLHVKRTEKQIQVATTVPSDALVEMDEGGSPVGYHLPASFMHLLTPQAYSKQKFSEMASGGKELHPSQVKLLKGSSLNARLGGPGDATLVKAMINMLPKPKIKPPSSPFEEAQW
jgi:2-C-methyl-D-erythritol 4-phosphate cytidylyltransferase